MIHFKQLFKNKYIKYSSIALIVCVVITGGYFTYRNITKANAQGNAQELTTVAGKGNLDVTITGTGTIEPISRYDIVPVVEGNVLSAPFEEGMKVKKDDLLYRIDDSDQANSIQRAQNTIERKKIDNSKTTENLNNLIVTAPFDGRMINFSLNEGDKVSAGKIADMVDDKRISAQIPFVEAQVMKISVGMNAQLKVVDDLLFVNGTVTNVSRTPSYTATGAMVFNVEITVENSGINVGTLVNGIVKSSDGDMFSYFTGTADYAKQGQLNAETSGKVKKIFIDNNEWVKAGQKILEIENDDLKDTIYLNSLDMKDSLLALEDAKKKLDDYNIVSPIDGTVIKKNYKTGDTIGKSSDSKILMTVADLSKMVFTIDVDELDIAKVEKGQKVSITADALPDSSFVGEVTNISVEGASQNGVTTYPVQVTINEPGKMMPGMNVSARILVESKKNVLLVPISAVTKMGDKSFVTVKTGGEIVDGSKATMSPNKKVRTGENTSGQRAQERQRRDVVVGINNDEFIEIVSGLEEGEIVYLQAVAAGASQNGPNVMRMGPPGFVGGPAGRTGGGVTIRTR